MSSCLLECARGPFLVPSLPAAQTDKPGDAEDSMAFSLVIPTYNESANIPVLVPEIVQTLDTRMPGRYEIIVVDDDSPDHTADVVEETAKNYPQLKLVRRTDERGLATAVVRGWQASRGSMLGVLDGDMQHPPIVLHSLLDKLEGGADIAVASRYILEEGLGDFSEMRRFLSSGAQSIARLIIGKALASVSDPMSGCFALRRSAIVDRKLSPSGYKILLEVLVRADTGNIQEVPFVFRERLHGQTKVSAREYFAYLWHLTKIWCYMLQK